MRDTKAAIEYFIDDKKSGEIWRRILFQAPAYAMERIAVLMYFSYYGSDLSAKETEEYQKLVDEIESTFEKEDLEYLIKVMPESDKDHYRLLLRNLVHKEQAATHEPLQQPKSDNEGKEKTNIILHCPKCNEELELPYDAVGWKVQCCYCEEKFFATEEFIKKQQEAQRPKTVHLKPVFRKPLSVNTPNTTKDVNISKPINQSKGKDLPTIYIKRPPDYMKSARELSEEEKLKQCAQGGDAKRDGAGSSQQKQERISPMKQNTNSSVSQQLGRRKKMTMDEVEQRVGQVLGKYRIFAMLGKINPYCYNVAVEKGAANKVTVVKAFNEMFHAFGVLPSGSSLDIGGVSDYCEIYFEGGCYFAPFNDPVVKTFMTSDKNYKYVMKVMRKQLGH